jgi:polysaccharide export outer membrane protein
MKTIFRILRKVPVLGVPGLAAGAILAVALIAGCARIPVVPSGTVKEIRDAASSPIVEQKTVAVPALEAGDPPAADYVIGPNDVLYVNVYGRPELGSPVHPFGGKIQGSRVDGLGNIHLPLVESAHVAGLTVGQTQERLKEAFRKYVQEPWVVVEVVEHRSRPLYLLGQFKAPGTYYMDRPLNLLEGVALGNGLDTTADLRGARLIRQERTQPVDVYDLLQNGDKSQNVWLKPGDTIYVPDDRAQNVFVFGAVTKPGPVPMLHGKLTLPQAIGAAGLRDIGYDLRHVRIIRSFSPTRGQLLAVDMNRVMAGEALPFPLMAGDIIYVPKSPVGNWNDAISEILPSLQAVSAILQPFVQIEFLRED